MLVIDGRSYGEDELVVHATRRAGLPYVMLAIDGSGVFVVRREGRRSSVHRADRPGLEALADLLGWPWLLGAVEGTSDKGH